MSQANKPAPVPLPKNLCLWVKAKDPAKLSPKEISKETIFLVHHKEEESR